MYPNVKTQFQKKEKLIHSGYFRFEQQHALQVTILVDIIYEFLDLYKTDVASTNLVLLFRNYSSITPHFLLFGKVIKSMIVQCAIYQSTLH